MTSSYICVSTNLSVLGFLLCLLVDGINGLGSLFTSRHPMSASQVGQVLYHKTNPRRCSFRLNYLVKLCKVLVNLYLKYIKNVGYYLILINIEQRKLRKQYFWGAVSGFRGSPFKQAIKHISGC